MQTSAFRPRAFLFQQLMSLFTHAPTWHTSATSNLHQRARFVASRTLSIGDIHIPLELQLLSHTRAANIQYPHLLQEAETVSCTCAVCRSSAVCPTLQTNGGSTAITQKPTWSVEPSLSPMASHRLDQKIDVVV